MRIVPLPLITIRHIIVGIASNTVKDITEIILAYGNSAGVIRPIDFEFYNGCITTNLHAIFQKG